MVQGFGTNGQRRREGEATEEIKKGEGRGGLQVVAMRQSLRKSGEGNLRKNNEQVNGEGEGEEPMATFSDDEEVEKPKKRPSKKRVVRDDDEEETAGGPRKKQLYVFSSFYQFCKITYTPFSYSKSKEMLSDTDDEGDGCVMMLIFIFGCLLISVSFNFLFSLLILLFSTAALRLLT